MSENLSPTLSLIVSAAQAVETLSALKGALGGLGAELAAFKQMQGGPATAVSGEAALLKSALRELTQSVATSAAETSGALSAMAEKQAQILDKILARAEGTAVKVKAASALAAAESAKAEKDLASGFNNVQTGAPINLAVQIQSAKMAGEAVVKEAAAAEAQKLRVVEAGAASNLRIQMNTAKVAGDASVAEFNKAEAAKKKAAEDAAAYMLSVQLRSAKMAGDFAIAEQKRIAAEAVASQRVAAVSGGVGAVGAAALAASRAAEKESAAAAALHAKTMRPLIDANTVAMKEAHSAARGLASGMNAMWLTWGSIVPLMAGAAISHGLVSAVKAGADFEYQLTLIKALSEDATYSVGEMGAKIKELSTGSLFSATETVGGLRALVTAGFDVKDAFTALPAVMRLAVAGEMQVGEAALIASSAMHAFKMGAGDIEHIGDVLAKAAAISATDVKSMADSMRLASTVADQYGLSIETVSEGLVLLAQRGIKGTSAGTAFRSMMTELAAPGQKAEQVMKALGIAVYDATTKQMKPQIEILDQLRDKLSQYDQQTQNSALKAIFNERGAKEASAYLAATSEQLAKIRQDLAEASGFMFRTVEELKTTTQGEFMTAMVTLKNSLLGVFTDLEPSLQGVLKAFKEMAGSSELKAFLVTTGKIVLDITEFMLSYGKAILGVATAYAVLRAAEAGLGGLALLTAGLTKAGGAAKLLTVETTAAAGATALLARAEGAVALNATAASLTATAVGAETAALRLTSVASVMSTVLTGAVGFLRMAGWVGLVVTVVYELAHAFGLVGSSADAAVGGERKVQSEYAKSIGLLDKEIARLKEKRDLQSRGVDTPAKANLQDVFASSAAKYDKSLTALQDAHKKGEATGIGSSAFNNMYAAQKEYEGIKSRVLEQATLENEEKAASAKAAAARNTEFQSRFGTKHLDINAIGKQPRSNSGAKQAEAVDLAATKAQLGAIDEAYKNHQGYIDDLAKQGILNERQRVVETESIQVSRLAADRSIYVELANNSKLHLVEREKYRGMIETIDAKIETEHRKSIDGVLLADKKMAEEQAKGITAIAETAKKQSMLREADASRPGLDALKKENAQLVENIKLVGKSAAEKADLKSQAESLAAYTLEETAAIYDQAAAYAKVYEAAADKIAIEQGLGVISEKASGIYTANAEAMRKEAVEIRTRSQLLTEMGDAEQLAQAQANWVGVLKNMMDQGSTAFRQFMSDGVSGWHSFTQKIRDVFKNTVVDYIYSAFAKPIFLQLVAGLAGSMGATSIAGAAAAEAAKSSMSMGGLASNGISLYNFGSTVGAGNTSLMGLGQAGYAGANMSAGEAAAAAQAYSQAGYPAVAQAITSGNSMFGASAGAAGAVEAAGAAGAGVAGAAAGASGAGVAGATTGLSTLPASVLPAEAAFGSAASGVAIGEGATTLGATATTTTTGGVVGGLSATGWGIIIAAVIVAVMALLPKGGGPKSGGSAWSGGTGERLYTPSNADNAFQVQTDSLLEQYKSIVKTVKGTEENVSFGMGGDTDPLGTAQNHVHSLVRSGGKTVYNSDVEAGRGTDEWAAAITLEAKKSLIGALKATDLGKAFNSLLASADMSDPDAILKSVMELKGYFDILQSFSSDNPFTTASTLAKQESKDAMTKYKEAGDALRALVSDGVTTMGKLSAAITDRYTTELTLAKQINDVRQGGVDMFAQSIRNAKYSATDNQGKYSILDQEADALRALLSKAIDVTTIQQTASKLNDAINSAFGLLDQGQQAAHLPEFIEKFEAAAKQEKERLDEAKKQVLEDHKALSDVVASAVDKALAKTGSLIDRAADAIPKEVVITVHNQSVFGVETTVIA